MSEEVVKYETGMVSLDDVKKYIAPKATEKELFMFMGICKAYGLNPMKREIHFIKYGESAASIVVGYEAYLKRAEKTGNLDGWEVKTDGKTATITIRRKDWKDPFVWTVERGEFYKEQANWKTMPNFMLKKVAIAQGFRMAFPVEMGGMPYIPEEISKGESESVPSNTSEDLHAEKDVPVYLVPKDEPRADKPEESPKNQIIRTEILSKKEWPSKKPGGNPAFQIMGHLEGNEQSFTTFDRKIFEMAKAETKTGMMFDLEYTKKVIGGKTYFNIVSLSPMEPGPGDEEQ